MKLTRDTIFFLPGLLLAALPAFAEESAGDIGFPQLKQTDTFASQIFWLGVSFVLLYALMSRIALPRVSEVIESRKGKRRHDLDEAGRMSEEAEKIRKSFEASLAKAQIEAQALLVSAGDAAAARTAAESAAFAETARKRLAAAEQNIARAKNDALASLSDISAEIAAEMAGKIAGTAVNKADAKIAVTGLMKG
jgi:F-type H+-transporting ATPase subunit b